jgi:hypothetical protein
MDALAARAWRVSMSSMQEHLWRLASNDIMGEQLERLDQAILRLLQLIPSIPDVKVRDSILHEIDALDAAMHAMREAKSAR